MKTQEDRHGALVRGAAFASIVAGAIHLIAIPSHLDHLLVVGFFWSVAAFQIVWGLEALGRRGPSWRAGGIVNVLVIATWLLSRTSGLPIGHHGGQPEAVGALDLAATALEMGIVWAAARSFTGARIRVRAVLRPAATLLALGTLLIASLPVSASSSGAQDAPSRKRGSSEPAQRPHAANMAEGYADGHVVVFTYHVQYFCTVDPDDDLDGPAHEGDGIIAAADPNEMTAPPCIVGATRSGSEPKTDPSGSDIQDARRLYGIIPSFDADGDGVDEDNDPTPGIQSHCPQPGPPYTQETGMKQTCTMHPTVAHAEPYLRTLAEISSGAVAPDVPVGDVAVGNHSHIVDVTRSGADWWLATVVVVNDASIWPDADGSCPAGRGCLTSVAAIRAAQRAGTAWPDMPTNVWFYFSVQRVAI